MKATITILAVATLLAGCWDGQEDGYGAPGDPGLELWADTDGGEQLDVALEEAQGDGLCMLDCSQGVACPAGQWCLQGAVAAICMADLGAYQTASAEALATCPPDSGWPCLCTAPGAPCDDGSTCVKLGPVNADLGVCMPTCETAEDCQETGTHPILCVEP